MSRGPGGWASGTGSCGCSPAIWTATEPRRGDVELRAVPRPLTATTAVARVVSGRGGQPASPKQSSTVHPGVDPSGRSPRVPVRSRAAEASFTAAACASATNVGGAAAVLVRWSTSSPRPSRWSAWNPARWWAVAANASVGGTCAGSTTTASGASATSVRCPTRSWRRGWPTRSLASALTSSRWPGRPSWCASKCSTRSSAVTRAHRRWTRSRCGSWPTAWKGPVRFVLPTLRKSAKAAASNTTRRSGACSATCAATWNEPGCSTPVPTLTPATSGRWRYWTCNPMGRGAGRPPREPSTSGSSSWAGCARWSRTGPATPVPTPAAARSVASLPRRLSDAGGCRSHRSGPLGRRGLRAHHAGHLRAASR